MSRLDQFSHETVEERQKQNLDMGAIGIGIGHDDDFFIMDIIDIEMRTDTRSYAMDDGVEFFVFLDLGDCRSFRIQDLAT